MEFYGCWQAYKQLCFDEKEKTWKQDEPAWRIVSESRTDGEQTMFVIQWDSINLSPRHTGTKTQPGVWAMSVHDMLCTFITVE